MDKTNTIEITNKSELRAGDYFKGTYTFRGEEHPFEGIVWTSDNYLYVGATAIKGDIKLVSATREVPTVPYGIYSYRADWAGKDNIYDGSRVHVWRQFKYTAKGWTELVQHDDSTFASFDSAYTQAEYAAGNLVLLTPTGQ